MQYTEIEQLRPTLALVWHDLGRNLPLIELNRGNIRVDSATGSTEIVPLGRGMWQVTSTGLPRPVELRNPELLDYLQNLRNVSRVYYHPRPGSTITILWDRGRPTKMTPTVLPPSRLETGPRVPPIPPRTQPREIPSISRELSYEPREIPRRQSFFQPSERLSSYFRNPPSRGVEPAAYPSSPVRRPITVAPIQSSSPRSQTGYEWAAQMAAEQRRRLQERAAPQSPKNSGQRSNYSPVLPQRQQQPSRYTTKGNLQLPSITRYQRYPEA
jgi:hypothetical protein